MSLPCRGLLFVVIAASAGVCAPGCTRRPEAPPTLPVMRIGVPAPSAGAGTGMDVAVQLLKGDDTWLTSRPDGRVSERVATEFTWDASGTTLRLKLRRDVYFQDGTLLTPAVAADALRATDRTQTYGFTNVVSIEPEGTDAVVFKLTEPNAFLLPDLGQLPVRKAGADNVGTGPYQIVKSAPNEVQLVAFPRYYRGKPGLAGIDVVNYPTQRNAWAALMRGDIDMLYEVSRDSAEFVKSETTVRSYRFNRTYYIPLVFNIRHPILRRSDVRQAINQALDRATLARDGLRSQGMPADGPVWPQHWAYSPPPQIYTFDPAAAARRLDAAGYPARPSEQHRVPLRFSFKCLLFGSDSRFERIALIVQKQLAEIGIDMQLEPLEMRPLGKRIAAGDFDAFIYEMSGRTLARVYDFWRSHEAMLNDSGYHAADAVLDRIRTARTESDTRSAVADLQRVMYDDPPAAFMVWQQTTRAVTNRFHVSEEPDRDILTNIWLWRPASSQQAAR